MATEWPDPGIVCETAEISGAAFTSKKVQPERVTPNRAKSLGVSGVPIALRQKKPATRSQIERACAFSGHTNHQRNGRQDHKHRREAVNTEGAFGGAFRCKNEQHVARGDDGFHKQDEADRAGRAPLRSIDFQS